MGPDSCCERERAAYADQTGGVIDSSQIGADVVRGRLALGTRSGAAEEPSRVDTAIGTSRRVRV